MKQPAFNNPWIKLQVLNSKKYILSDLQRFEVTFISSDLDAVNKHCDKHEDRGVIAIDENGNYYVALIEPS